MQPVDHRSATDPPLQRLELIIEYEDENGIYRGADTDVLETERFGEVVQLRCRARGVPQPERIWWQGQATADPFKAILPVPSLTAETRLTVIPTTTTKYTCKAQSTIGIVSRSVDLLFLLHATSVNGLKLTYRNLQD